jgi:hypothetical protein
LISTTTFRYVWNQEGPDKRYPILHPDSYQAVYDYVKKARLVARTWAGQATMRREGPLADPETFWILEEVVPDPETLSGFKTRGVTYLSRPDSTDIETVYTPWMCLSWFVPASALDTPPARV